MCLISCTPISKSASRQHHSRCTMKIFIHHTTVAYRTEKKMLKSLSKQSDYDNRYELLNGKVGLIQKTLTSHKFFDKFFFFIFIRSSLGNSKLK